jgi:enolase
MASETFHTLKIILAKDGHITSVGDEGGFAPNLKDHDEAFRYIVKAIEESGYRPGPEISLAIDAAASEFYKDGKYILAGEKKNLSSGTWSPISPSSPPNTHRVHRGRLAEGDWDGWKI